jgi:hypothetical protein
MCATSDFRDGEGFSESQGKYGRLKYLSFSDSGTQAFGEVAANAAKGYRYPAKGYTYEVVGHGYSSLCSESRVY